MINVRYYVILLIGIFLSLGLGIMMGITLESNDLLENQRELIADQIEQEILKLKLETDRLKSEKDVLKEQKAQADMFSNLLLASFAEDRLNGLRVSLVNLGTEYGYSEVKTFLSVAGGLLGADISVCDSIHTIDMQNIKETYLRDNHDESIDRIKLYEVMVRDLLEAISNNIFTPFFAHLNEMGIVNGSWNTEHGGSDVLIIGGNGANLNTESVQPGVLLSTLIIEAALDAGMNVVVIESLQSESANLDEYNRLGVTTVSDVDTVYGRLALLSLLEEYYNAAE